MILLHEVYKDIAIQVYVKKSTRASIRLTVSYDEGLLQMGSSRGRFMLVQLLEGVARISYALSGHWTRCEVNLEYIVIDSVVQVGFSSSLRQKIKSQRSGQKITFTPTCETAG